MTHTNTQTFGEKKTYQCSRCDKEFATKSSLKGHMAAQFGEKPYQCIQSNFFNNNVKMLLETHSGKKSYK